MKTKYNVEWVRNEGKWRITADGIDISRLMPFELITSINIDTHIEEGEPEEWKPCKQGLDEDEWVDKNEYWLSEITDRRVEWYKLYELFNAREQSAKLAENKPKLGNIAQYYYRRNVAEDIQNRFNRYVSSFDKTNSMIKRKYDHTIGVASIMQEWNNSLLSLALGFYHDLGRFLQATYYKTFVDKESIDHALWSVIALERNPYLTKGMTEKEKRILTQAIKYHSRLTLPEDMAEDERHWCEILRDADMLENLQRFKIDSVNITGGYTISELERQVITPEVEDCLKDGKLVDSQYVKTGMDIVCRYIGFANEMKTDYPKKELEEICGMFSDEMQERLRQYIK